jgi:hypothetical protein
MDKEKIKKDLLDGFKFEKAKEIMEILDWKLVLPTGYHVPSTEELREFVSGLVDDFLKDERVTFISSGGFRVEKTSMINDEEYDTIRLVFEAIKSYSDL